MISDLLHSLLFLLIIVNAMTIGAFFSLLVVMEILIQDESEADKWMWRRLVKRILESILRKI